MKKKIWLIVVIIFLMVSISDCGSKKELENSNNMSYDENLQMRYEELKKENAKLKEQLNEAGKDTDSSYGEKKDDLFDENKASFDTNSNLNNISGGFYKYALNSNEKLGEFAGIMTDRLTGINEIEAALPVREGELKFNLIEADEKYVSIYVSDLEPNIIYNAKITDDAESYNLKIINDMKMSCVAYFRSTTENNEFCGGMFDYELAAIPSRDLNSEVAVFETSIVNSKDFHKGEPRYLRICYEFVDGEKLANVIRNEAIMRLSNLDDMSNITASKAYIYNDLDYDCEIACNEDELALCEPFHDTLRSGDLYGYSRIDMDSISIVE